MINYKQAMAPAHAHSVNLVQKWSADGGSEAVRLQIQVKNWFKTQTFYLTSSLLWI